MVVMALQFTVEQNHGDQTGGGHRSDTFDSTYNTV
jgi:hypothetical protein